MRRLLLIAISAAGGLAGVTALLFAISNSGPTRQEKAPLSIRNEQSRIVVDPPTPDTTSRPARIESSFDIENAGDITAYPGTNGAPRPPSVTSSRRSG